MSAPQFTTDAEAIAALRTQLVDADASVLVLGGQVEALKVELAATTNARVAGAPGFEELREALRAARACPHAHFDISDVRTAVRAAGFGDHAANLVTLATRDAPALLAALDGAEAQVAEARSNFLRCAQAIGVSYEADGVASAPGPIEEVERYIREAVRKAGEWDARNERGRCEACNGILARGNICNDCAENIR